LAEHLAVRFPYSEKQAREATSEGEEMGAPRLEKLLATLLEELPDAAILLDDWRCLELVERIDHVDGEIGARVRRMVNTFQYQELLVGFDPLAGSRSK
jgi:hypothetical protein